MLVAISGSQGSGKSTTLQGLADRGFNVIERKTSRSILSDWNVSLQEVNNDPELTTKFQDEIGDRKFKDEIGALQSNELWFTERTHSDLFAYALISIGKDNQYSEWMNKYYGRCVEYNKMYSQVFYLSGGLFDVEADGVRGANKHYSRLVDTAMFDFTRRMLEHERLDVIDFINLENRLDHIVDVTSAII